MKLLLDTHVPPRVRPIRSPHIGGASGGEDGTHDVLVSIVTEWEIAIKQSLGKLELAKPAEVWLPDVLKRTGYEIAELGLPAALRVRGLPSPD